LLHHISADGNRSSDEAAEFAHDRGDWDGRMQLQQLVSADDEDVNKVMKTVDKSVSYYSL